MAPRVVAVLLAAAVPALGQWAGVSSIGTGAYTTCPAVTTYPSTLSPLEVTTSGFVSIYFEAWCSGTPVSGLATPYCGQTGALRLLDDGDDVSTLEAEAVVSVAPGTVQTLILIDLSNSIIQNTAEALTSVKAAVQQFISTVMASSGTTGTHEMAIHAFDGRTDTQMVYDWSTDATALYNAVGNIACDQTSLSGTLFCQDPSTNLYGTLIWGASELSSRQASAGIRATSRGYDSAMVVFTDGRDLAGRASITDARAAIVSAGVLTFAAGLQNAAMTEAQQIAELTKFTGDSNAAFIGELTTLTNVYQNLASLIISYFSRSYVITYCSPRRNNYHSLQVSVVRSSGTTSTRMEFLVGSAVLYTVPGTDTSYIGQVTSIASGPLYTVTFPTVGIADISDISPSALALYYSAASFTSPATCYTVSSYTSPCNSVSGSYAAYSCTGGGVYDCSTATCDCPYTAYTTCAASYCYVQDQTQIAPLYVERACPTGLPASPQTAANFSWSSNSQISMTFKAVCADGTGIGGLTFSSCADLSSIVLYETNANGVFQEVSLYESRPRITCVPQAAHIVSVMLLDMSGSILRGYGALERLQNMAVAYLTGLSNSVTSHVVAVYTFDGTSSIRLLTDFGTAASAINAINNLECGTTRCLDPSTNLNGAVIYANSLLKTYMVNNGYASDGVSRQPFIAVFSDGADQAQWYTDAEAQASATNGTGIFAIGLQGEVRTGSTYMRGVDVTRLEALASGGVFILDTAAELEDAFGSLSSAIASAAAYSYRLDYCSPKRNGTHTVRVQITHYGATSYWEQSFNANLFECESGQCNDCLGGIITSEFSCTNQPTAEYQAFKCSTGTPTVVDGYCRCPCTLDADYPDSTVIGPGPIICEEQGTCADTDRITCTTHGGISADTSSFDRFGVSNNSRVSMEFAPECSDGWPIPGLRMSSCSELSDFTVYESNSQGVMEKIDIFEAEPRVMCYPDVVSLILLDTSGSIRSGGTGIASLKSAVITYIQELQALTVTHSVGIYAFDGRSNIQEIIGFTTNTDTVLTTMTNWYCDGSTYCSDFSTNLYGAVQQAEAVLRAEVGSYVWRQQSYLVIFTDGTDQAGRVTQATAISAISAGVADYSLSVYGVGLIGETSDGSQGLDADVLASLAVNGVYTATDLVDLEDQFVNVAQEVIAATQSFGSTTYRIDYCSPKREGVTTVIVELQYEGYSKNWTGTFNANNFDCGNSNACGLCLSNLQYNCTDQPPISTEVQYFSCASGLTPVVHNGRCKCPCVDTTYPPDVTTAPATPTPAYSGQTSAPTISPASGSYSGAVVVTMSSVPSAASIYYTTDGTSPTTASTLYTGSFVVSNSATINAIATYTGYLASDVTSVAYTIAGTTPTPGTSITNALNCGTFSVTGFTVVSGLNTVYTRDTTQTVNGYATFWSADSAYFFYWCASDNRWRIGEAAQYSSIASTCLAVARGPVTTYQYLFLTNWEETASTSFDTDVTLTFANCNTASTSNNPPTATVAISSITATATGAQTVSSVFTGVTPGTGETSTQTVSATCTPVTSGVVSSNTVAISIGSDQTAAITYTPVILTSQASTVVTCTFVDSLSSSITRSFTIIVPVLSSTVSNWQTFRIALKMSISDFSYSKFVNILKSLMPSDLPFTNPYVNWVCPETACYTNSLLCDTDNSACLSGTSLASTKRAAVSLAASEDIIYVDFDFDTTTSSLTTAQLDAYMEAMQAALNDDLDDCWDGDACTFGSVDPVNDVILVPTTGATFPPHQDTDGDSDDGMETWLLILIICLCVLACCLLLLLLYCCNKKSKKNKDKGYSQGSQRSKSKDKEMSQYDDSYYSKSKGQTSYYDDTRDSKKSRGGSQTGSYYDDGSYYSQSKGQTSYYDSYAVEEFYPDEQVRALYVDGQWYDATIYEKAPDGTYEVKWYDGQHSEGIPPEQIQRIN